MGYERVAAKLAADECVILDGGNATELQRLRRATRPLREGELWGSWALYRAPEVVLEAHRRYVAAGCDVVTANTWSLLGAGELETGQPHELDHWTAVARSAVELAREAAAEEGRGGDVAVAFSLSEEVLRQSRETVELLRRVWDAQPPDLLLVETLTLVRDPATFDGVRALVDTGLPVWLSFRRCRHGACGVYGQHWGPPEGDAFGRAARRFEELGVQALLVNCLPADHVTGMLSWLSDFTSLPLGAYPNLGRLAGSLWRFDDSVAPDDYARLALAWREEGAQIVGGCCGVTPDHVAAAARALAGTKRGHAHPTPVHDVAGELGPDDAHPAQWLDGRGRPLFPLPFPSLVVEPGVFVPTQGSYLLWKHLFREGIGAGRRCVDMGCGCGILTVQLALNGAEQVLAVDIDRDAVANTISNAFRHGVGEVVTGEDADLYQWEPPERFDVVVASLYQMPVDPFEEASGHRPLDYWGRNLLDHFLDLLPRLLAEGGVAYVMQLSIIGQRETQRRLAAAGLEARVVDWSFFPFGPLFLENREQIARVEERSDAYHLAVGGEDVMVAYLLEVCAGAFRERHGRAERPE